MDVSRQPEPEDRPTVPVAVAAAAGAASTVLAGLAPTGHTLTDAVLAAAAGALVVAAACSAPWWALVVAAAVGAAFAGSVVVAVVSAVGAVAVLAAAVMAGDRARRAAPWAAAIGAVTAAAALARLDGGPWPSIPAFPTVAAVATASILVVLGLRRSPRRVRRPAVAVIAAAGGFAVVGTAVFGLSAWRSADDVRAGDAAAGAADRALHQGELDTARQALDTAATAMDGASDTLHAWWATPARFVPVAAQHQRALRSVTGAAAVALDRSAGALAGVDPDTLRMVDGTIDIPAVTAADAPLREVDAAMTDLAATLDGIDPAWLAGPLVERLDEFRRRIVDGRADLADVRAAIAVAPGLLGQGGERRYLVAFLNPGEARGLGGHLGNYAEITVRDGRFELTGFGRGAGLNSRGADPEARTVSGPPDFLERWGRFGFLEADGTTSDMPWSNLTMPPDLPTVGQVMAELYPQSGGRPIDGVVQVQPAALAMLVRATGTVRAPGIDKAITPKNVQAFIETEQYEVYDGANRDRFDALEDVARITFERFFGGKAKPINLLGELRGLAADRSLSVWSRHDAEQAYFAGVGVDGAFPALDGRDGIAVTVDNGGANKLDAYLDVSTVYRSQHDPGTGAATATATITLTNTVDPAGKSTYAVGNAYGLPLGTNRMMLSTYSALPAAAITVDDRPVTIDGRTAAIDGDTTFGWHTSELWLDLAPGATTTVTVRFAGVLDPAAAGDIVVRSQPMVRTQQYDVAAG